MKKLFRSALHIARLPFMLIGVIALIISMCVAETYTKIKEGE